METKYSAEIYFLDYLKILDKEKERISLINMLI